MRPNNLKRYLFARRTALVRWVFPVVALMASLPGYAGDFLVYPLITAVDGAGKGDARLSVHSKSATTQFVRIRVVQVLDPATPKEREVAVDAADSSNLLVMPRRLVVPAGATRSVRVLLQNPPEHEDIYRVYFESVNAFDEMRPDEKKTEASVSFSIVFGATIRTLPVEKHATLALTSSRDALLNTGNMRIGVLRVGLCPPGASGDGCEWTDLKRSIYPGSQWPLPWRADQRRVVARIRTSDDQQERDVELP